MRSIIIKGVEDTAEDIQTIKREYNVISLRTATNPIPTETIGYSEIDEHMDPEYLCVETFDDVSSTETKFIAPEYDQIKNIILWAMEKSRTNDRPFLVHCTAGISRSSAIAILISQILNDQFHHIFNPMIHDPNGLIIRYGEKVANISISENIRAQKRAVKREQNITLL